MLAKRRLHLRECGARLDGECQVGRLIHKDAIERLRRNGEVERCRNVAKTEHRSAADRGDSRAIGCRSRENLSKLRRGVRPLDASQSLTVDDDCIGVTIQMSVHHLVRFLVWVRGFRTSYIGKMPYFWAMAFARSARTSPHTYPFGKSFSGFNMPAGSNAFFTPAIAARSSPVKTSSIYPRFSVPMPCSPESAPPISTQKVINSLLASNTRSTSPFLCRSKSMSGCR